jgi:hypothetical protein
MSEHINNSDYYAIPFEELKKVYDENKLEKEKIITEDDKFWYFPAKTEGDKLIDYAAELDLDRDYKYYTLDTNFIDVPEPFCKFLSKTDRKGIDKWSNYFEVYDTYFGKYRNKPVKMLEIGIFRGGSLQMWKEYFGEDAEIVGVDINPDCKKYEEAGVRIRIGSQEDPDFLKEVIAEFGPFDIILDDGGHTMNQQIVSFETLFSAVKDGGVYMCEDLHTSYWAAYGGGLKLSGTFIEYTKNLIDEIHGWHMIDGRSDITRSVKSLHFYDSIIAIEKAVITPPVRMYLVAEGNYKEE